MMRKEHEPAARALLVIGHPGHELRILGWVARTKPLVCVLTDGSGSDEIPRTEQTRAVLAETGARIGPVFGDMTDRQIYQHMLSQDGAPFEALCERLAQLIVEQRVEIVVSDAVEGYNPTHDLCEVLTRAAVEIANTRQMHQTQHYIIPLMGDPSSLGDDMDGEQIQIVLEADQFKHKMDAIRAYATKAGAVLQQEVEDTFRTYGEAAFSCEHLFATAAGEPHWERRFGGKQPHYEVYGEKQVAAGRYQFVIRFRQHVLPLANGLRKHHAKAMADANGGEPCVS
ncbi:hypothetical protein [Dyella subtropica]|uniref:hypothetical protein n=1 Tax=Dyella subtropica TaxID=2992127 RepID=UPI0022557996|nr:hypothetical protein [Dyella subtropica]